MRNKNYTFLSHDYPNLFYVELVVFSLSYVFLKDEDDWKKLTATRQSEIRDSVKKHHKLPNDAHVYMTTGKKSFYDFKTFKKI